MLDALLARINVLCDIVIGLDSWLRKERSCMTDKVHELQCELLERDRLLANEKKNVQYEKQRGVKEASKLRKEIRLLTIECNEEKKLRGRAGRRRA